MNSKSWFAKSARICRRAPEKACGGNDRPRVSGRGNAFAIPGVSRDGIAWNGIAPAVVLVLLGLLPAAPVSTEAQEDANPSIPVGSLTAFPTMVQTGTHPTLTWDVTHPEKIDDIIDIEPPGTLVPKKDLIMDVRVIGASVKRVWLNSWGQVVDWEWVPTEAKMSYNGGSYDRIWYDTQDDVNPDEIVVSQHVYGGDEINFGARYLNSNGSWATFFSSTNSTYNVVALQNGDTPPTTTPLYQQPTIESFILPYLDNNGNIAIGPKDVIYLMELTHTNRYDGGFDLQDMCILVTFLEEETGKTNNGHGNNEDGVDISNPGDGGGGPNGEEDTSAPDDDETSNGRGRRKK